jgi:uncharacterized protein YjbI with pentapeptide repeats
MADAKHVELVRSGVDSLNAFAKEHQDVSLDLRGADLHGLDLRGARIQGARLAGANLRECDFRDARLNSSDMRGCDLRGADLRNTSMHRAVLTGSDLRGTRLGRLGVGHQRMCISPATFDDVNWERDELERILEMINLNPDYEVRYEIVPRA